MPLPPPGGDVTTVELEHPHQRHPDNRAILTASLSKTALKRPPSLLGSQDKFGSGGGREGVGVLVGYEGEFVADILLLSRFHEEERLVTDPEESGSGGIHRGLDVNPQTRRTRCVPWSCSERSRGPTPGYQSST
ncbi:hypothetical protein ILYODFUR_022838 [Ilyodon furcidens]|uniref:Uncharacterized protein n=1 Tax=Ilyodon furcidens TaxID=33524 RepID=A0ABV0UUB7_9TELE